MKNVVAIFALLFISTSGQAQSTNSNFRPELLREQLIAFNFINNVSFTPESTATSHTAVSEPEATDAIESISTMQFKYAMLLDVDVESVSNSALFNFIEDWYGTRYRMGGTTKKGIDCSAFTGALLSSVYSFNVPRTAHEQYKVCERINKEDLKTGDLVFFNTRGGVSHVGIYLTNNRFVHSASTNGVSISNLEDSYYAQRFISGGRISQ